MGRKRFAARALVATLALGTVGLIGAPAAHARPSSQSLQLTRLHNIERWDDGMHGLRFNKTLSSIARRHSLRMADAGEIYHSTDLTRRVRDWRILGENVGVGPSIQDLHDAFMGSPGHRRNILEDEYRDVGVGVVKDAAGTYWVTVIFRG